MFLKVTVLFRLVILWVPVVDKFRTLNWQKIKREVEESGILAMFPSLELQN